MNRSLARKVLEFFRDDACPHPTYFENFSARDWRTTKDWIDSSGVALYFLERLKNLRLENSVPKAILEELEQNHRDRKLEVKQRCEVFADLIKLFQQHQIGFIVEKGFALVPDYCPDISLRFQVDFDFLIAGCDVERCHELFLDKGYRYLPNPPAIEGERRFSKGDTTIPSLRDFYKPRPRHAVELHFDDSEATATMLARTVTHRAIDLAFPAMGRVDCFAEYVLHFKKHLHCGWVRADALLEYRCFLRLMAANKSFWAEVQHKCAASHELREAVAIFALLAREVLGVPVIPELTHMVLSMPFGVRRWVHRYAWSVLLTEYPGTKLYVILELESGRHDLLSCLRRLFPSAYKASQVAEKGRTSASKRQALLTQSLYFMSRCHFHLRETIRTSCALIAWTWATRGRAHYDAA